MPLAALVPIVAESFIIGSDYVVTFVHQLNALNEREQHFRRSLKPTFSSLALMIDFMQRR